MAASRRSVDQECVEGYLFVREPPRILLLRRPPARGSIWVPVSGRVEPSDADYLHALTRELAEETGFSDPRRIFPLDWHVVFPGPDGRTWRLHAYAVELDRPREPTLSEEHDAFEWVLPREAERRLHFSDNREAVRRLLELTALEPPGPVPPRGSATAPGPEGA